MIYFSFIKCTNPHILYYGGNMYKGLTDNEVITNRKIHGSNDIARKKHDSFIKLLSDL